ncbi:MAG: hypothetical protein WAN10_01285 [Candidatus Acidiferrales bacterium]
MTAAATEEPKEAKETQTNRATRGARKTQTVAGGREIERFFLAKPGNSGSAPELGKEFSGEPEAIVESLKTGLHYFMISEWRGVADFSGKRPQLLREPAHSLKAG